MRSWSVWCMVFLSVALFEFSWVTCKPANNYSKSWVRLSTWLIFKLNGSAAKLKDCFWNFTAAGNKLCEDMNSGLPRTNPGNGQGGTKTLDQTMQVRPSNGSFTTVLTFKSDCKLTNSSFVVVRRGTAVHSWRSPGKSCSVFEIAFNRQVSVTVVLKLWRFPCYSLAVCWSNILVWWTIYNLWAWIICEYNVNIFNAGLPDSWFG